MDKDKDLNRRNDNSTKNNVAQEKKQQEQIKKQSMQVDTERKDNNVNDGEIFAEDVTNNNLKDYLVQEGFTQFGKLESDFNSAELTFNDIIRMSESDLETMLSKEYKVKVVQKNRFIRAVKKLPRSKVYQPRYRM